MAIYRFDSKECEDAYGRDFIAIDPGVDGGSVVFVDKAPVECLGTALDVESISDAMIRHKVSTIVVERQFVKMNPASALELAWRTGMMLGAVARDLGGDVFMVEVYPTTWQTDQKRRMRIKEKLNRKQGIQLALTAAEMILGPLWDTQVQGNKKAVIEGIASATGIGVWFLGLQVD